MFNNSNLFNSKCNTSSLAANKNVVRSNSDQIWLWFPTHLNGCTAFWYDGVGLMQPKN